MNDAIARNPSRSRLLVAASLLLFSGPAGAESSSEWPHYGNDPGGMRYAPLDQITSFRIVVKYTGQLLNMIVQLIAKPPDNPFARRSGPAALQVHKDTTQKGQHSNGRRR